MRLLTLAIVSVVVSTVLLITSPSDGQILRRFGRSASGGYYEMGCDCRNCVANRGGTYAQVYGQATKSKEPVPEKNPSAPTPTPVVDIMVRLADLSEDDLLYDPGCGDGRILEAAVRDTGCKAVGIEIDPRVSAKAVKRMHDSGLRGWRVVNEDSKKLLLDKATVACLYMYPEDMAQIIPRLKGCTRIVSFLHPIEGEHCRRVDTPDGPVYVADRRELSYDMRDMRDMGLAYEMAPKPSPTPAPARKKTVRTVVRSSCATGTCSTCR